MMYEMRCPSLHKQHTVGELWNYYYYVLFEVILRSVSH